MSRHVHMAPPILRLLDSSSWAEVDRASDALASNQVVDGRRCTPYSVSHCEPPGRDCPCSAGVGPEPGPNAASGLGLSMSGNPIHHRCSGIVKKNSVSSGVEVTAILPPCA